MPEVPPGVYSNPIAPPDGEVGEKHNLSNEDFRKLMMTPRASSSSSSKLLSSVSSAKPTSNQSKSQPSSSRAAKKSFYSKLRKEEDEREAEWAEKYRDRAKERRDGANPDYGGAEDTSTSTSGYKAVAPNVDPKVQAEQRKKQIQESKYLGGDLEHTHLVKGLDYALLQKVRSEITVQEHEEEEMQLLEKRIERERSRAEAIQEDITFKTTMAKNLYRSLFLAKPADKNELFFPGRMAYIFELEDEYAESDIPTTLIRSKADCPMMEVTTLTTNDIVINKLTQILSYLRQGPRASKKGRKRDRGKVQDEHLLKVQPAQESIFPDVGQYVFDPKKHTRGHHPTGHHSGQHGTASMLEPLTGQLSGQMTKGKYFRSTAGEEEAVSERDIQKETVQLVKAVAKRFPGEEMPPEVGSGGWPSRAPKTSDQNEQATGASKPDKTGKTGFSGLALDDHYAECYPGMAEEYDATYDSDDEADYTKMDMGNKKGPVKRWDFETEEEYSSYQSGREAMPKAAFQYGVKMAEGRKTRRYTGLSDKAKEKAKLNREWQKISRLIDKRKNPGADEPSTKKSKVE